MPTRFRNLNSFALSAGVMLGHVSSHLNKSFGCIRSWVAERRHAGHQFRDEATSQRSQRQTPMAVANLWRAVDAEGEVLVLVHAKKNKRD